MLESIDSIREAEAPVRVMMITDVFFPRINGVSTSIETFCADLPRYNIDVTVVAPEYPDALRTSDIRRVPARRLPFDPEDRLMRWNALCETADRVADEGVDVVHVQTPFAAHYAGLRVARRRRVPIIATYHTHFEEYIQHYLPVLPRAILRAVARGLARHQCDELDAVVVPSPAMAETLEQYGVRAELKVLPTGIPVDQFDKGYRRRFRAQHGIAEGRLVALYVGRVAHEKNIDFLLEAMVHAITVEPGLLLLIAGEGPALADLRLQVEHLRLSDHVRFLGYLDRRTELPDCYAAADVFAFASRTETQGLVLLEAMAAGLPVLAISHLGTRSILEPRQGAVVAPESPLEFGIRLALLAGNSHERARLSGEARQFALQWSAPERARQLAQLYRGLLG